MLESNFKRKLITNEIQFITKRRNKEKKKVGKIERKTIRKNLFFF